MSCVKYDQQDQQEKKGTWKIGLIAGHAAGLPPGIKEGPYLATIMKKWKKSLTIKQLTITLFKTTYKQQAKCLSV